MTDSRQIAHTILQQIKGGDYWCLAACGARDYVSLDRNENRRGGVMFRVTIDRRKFHKIIVTLTHMDEYNVELVRFDQKTLESTVEKSIEGIYCDTLAKVVYDFCNR